MEDYVHDKVSMLFSFFVSIQILNEEFLIPGFARGKVTGVHFCSLNCGPPYDR